MTRTLWAAALVGGSAVVLLLPYYATPYVVTIVLLMFMYLTLSSSWNILSGFAGYPSFGHVAFFGVGAYAAALLITRADMAWPAAALAGGLAAGVAAAAIGGIVLRLRSVFFAITTLGLAEALRIVAQIWDSVTGGGQGIALPPIASLTPFYYAMVGLGALGVLSNFLVARSNFGLQLLGIREDEEAASAIGVNTTRCKIAAFIMSSVLPGVAGGVYARYISYIEPISVLGVLVSVQMVTMALLGGAGTVLGPVIGVVILSVVGELFWASFPFFHRALYGVLIVAVVFLMPGGIVETLKAKRVLKRTRSI